MTLRVAITGVDGTGKTTVVRALRQRYRATPSIACAFRAPQYHEDPNLPHGELSRAIDELSVAADLQGDAGLKSVALFLSMTLYGDVERHVLTSYRPRLLFAERQCVVDSLAYAQFYLPKLLEGGGGRGAAPPALPGLEGWLDVLRFREPSIVLEPSALTQYLIQVFSGSPEQIVARLLRLFNAELPDRVIVLTATPECLARRLAEKKAGTPVAELHEQAETLHGLLRSLRASALLARSLKPSLEVSELDTSRLSIDETVEAVIALTSA